MALSFKQSLAYFWEQIGKQFLKNGKDVDYEVLLPKTTLEPNDGGFAIPDTIGVPVGGQEYTVVYNGETYYCTAQNGASTGTGHICVIGDASQLNVEGMPAGDKNMPFLIALAIEDSSNTITESIFQSWDDAASVTLEILVNAGPVYLTKNLNNEITWIEREFYDRGNTITEVIKNGYLESDMDGTYLRGDFVGAITAGHTYVVHTDNGDYECKAWKIPEDIIQQVGDAQFQDIYRNFVVLGSSDARMVFFPIMDGVNIDTDIPFTLAFAPGGLFGDTTLALVNLDSDFPTNNLNIDEKSANIKKLDPKYIHTPDWDAGENDPGYIANKTHGYEYSENALLVSLSLNDITSEEEMLAYLAKPLGLVAGEKYTVILDDTSYETVASTATVSGLAVTYLGDLAALEDSSTASVPFCIPELSTPMEGMYWFPTAEAQTLLEIRGRGKIIKKLSDDFINWPDWLPQITEVDTTVYYDKTGYSWTQVDNGRYMIDTLSDTAQLLAVDWEEGAFYTTQFNDNDLRLHCIYEPGSYDIPKCYILCEPQYTDLFSAANSSRVAFIIYITHNKVSVIAQTSLSRVIIKNKAKYTKQISPYAIQGLPYSLINGSGENSLQTRNLGGNGASGANSIALGYHSNAVADNSFVWNGVVQPVENYDNAYTHSIAGSAEAKGAGSIALSGHSEGRRSFAVQGGYAKGEHSIALGNTRAYGTNQTTIGMYNNTDTENKYSLIVGNGTGWGEFEGVQRQSNAFTINWDGKIWAKDLYMNGTDDSNASHVASETYVNNQVALCLTQSTADGRYQLKSERIFDTVSGQNNAMGPIGAYNTNYTLGYGSFTWGTNASAQAGYTFALGYNATVFAEANYSYALGQGATVYDGALNSYAIGYGATIAYDVDNAFAIGDHVNANTANQTVLGKYNKTNTSYLFVLGNGTSSARSNAFAINSSGTGYFTGDLYVNGSGTTTAFTGAKKVATESYVDTKVAGLVDSAPGTLNTLNELAAALGDDPNFATTMATELGKKADKTDLVALTEAEILEVCVIN